MGQEREGTCQGDRCQTLLEVKGLQLNADGWEAVGLGHFITWNWPEGEQAVGRGSLGAGKAAGTPVWGFLHRPAWGAKWRLGVQRRLVVIRSLGGSPSNTQ